MLDHRQFEKAENVDVALPRRCWARNEDFEFELTCLCEALLQCSSPHASAKCVLIISEVQGRQKLSVPLHNGETFSLTCAPHLGWIGEPINYHGNTRLCIPTEDWEKWPRERITVDFKQAKSSIQDLVQKGFAEEKQSGSQGDHQQWTVTVEDYLPWRRPLCNTDEKVRDHCNRCDEHCRYLKDLNVQNVAEFSVPFVLDAGRNHFPYDFAKEKGKEAGLSKARAWWLFYGGHKEENPKRLADVLGEVRQIKFSKSG
ncbi:MAG: hypothetical protein K9N51_03185 [Candidatus Pacebacteria bacterium]|nr:hypothetical protein [Candidatus Paceibacterota bacterium]